VLVWDDEIEISDDNVPVIHSGPTSNGPKSPQSPHSPQTPINVAPIPVVPPRSRRSQSVTNFPPPMRRVSTEFSGVSRPVSFSAKFSRVHPATTGVVVLEHMERLDAVEASLKRLGVEEEETIEDEETDVGTVRSKTASKKPQSQDPEAEPILSPSGRSERLPVVPENDGTDEFEQGMTEEDLVAMSKSMPQLESPTPLHTRWTTTEERPSFDWIDAASSPRRRLVIAEVSTPHLFSLDVTYTSVAIAP
jgi:phosphatidylinositol 4-kinase type 2